MSSLPVSVLWYPSAQHSKLRVGNSAISGLCCNEQKAQLVGYDALSTKSEQAGKKAFLEFHIENLTPKQLMDLRRIDPDSCKGATCMEVVAGQLEEKAGFRIPSYLAPYPFCSAAYLASLHYLGDERVGAIELHGTLSQGDIPSIAKYALEEVVAAQIHLGYYVVSSLYNYVAERGNCKKSAEI